MTEYIRKDAIVLNTLNIYNKMSGITMKQKEWIVDENAETVNIVRCKDCKWSDDKFFSELKHSVWCKSHGCLRNEDWFCADGRLKEGEE